MQTAHAVNLFGLGPVGRNSSSVDRHFPPIANISIQQPL